MKTDFDFPRKDLLGSVVFRPDFNNFAAINVNQAWSLFLTAGKDDKLLGEQTELGKFLTNLLIGIGVTGILWVSLFKNFG
ncbi:MAG: hypothetical protein HC836_14960 [Richelia sp. RM2_1_2]|nr:hypothetical protein [Richelia sp. SM1_7_0]NJN09491.1 hypothetical protein [Richelia sp. RM1_1_1]NJO27209.1 hypothetical protein [Richelia sp. SL_2_1]NJO59547.1 hypothetical protein [Richelia sp. RM2_1_2]